MSSKSNNVFNKFEGIFLGGNSLTNLPWVEQLSAKLKDLFSTVYVHKYLHWQTNNVLIDLREESSRLERSLVSKKYVIVAKSAGAVLAIKEISEKKIFPEKCIFLGLPLRWAEDHNLPLKKWIKNLNVPALFIQNTEDPLLSSVELKQLLISNHLSKYTIVELDNRTHDYLDFNTMKKEIIIFLEYH